MSEEQKDEMVRRAVQRLNALGGVAGADIVDWLRAHLEADTYAELGTELDIGERIARVYA